MPDATDEVQRRWKILSKALDVYSLEEALDLARRAEEFVTKGLGADPRPSDGASESTQLVAAADVIGYLREQGDTISGDGAEYVLNSAAATFAELVQRANDMRVARNLPLFPVHTHRIHSPSAAISVCKC